MRPPEAMQMLDSPACRLISLRKRRSRHQRCTYLGAECQVRLGKTVRQIYIHDYVYMHICMHAYIRLPPPLSHAENHFRMACSNIFVPFEL